MTSAISPKTGPGLELSEVGVDGGEVTEFAPGEALMTDSGSAATRAGEASTDGLGSSEIDGATEANGVGLGVGAGFGVAVGRGVGFGVAAGCGADFWTATGCTDTQRPSHAIFTPP